MTPLYAKTQHMAPGAVSYWRDRAGKDFACSVWDKPPAVGETMELHGRVYLVAGVVDHQPELVPTVFVARRAA